MPATSQPQHLVALARANHIRVSRCALKRDITEGRRTAAEIIAQPPENARTMSVYDVLMAQHRWGRSRALKLLHVAQVREGKELEALTARQRQVLVDLLVWGTA